MLLEQEKYLHWNGGIYLVRLFSLFGELLDSFGYQGVPDEFFEQILGFRWILKILEKKTSLILKPELP